MTKPLFQRIGLKQTYAPKVTQTPLGSASIEKGIFNNGPSG